VRRINVDWVTGLPDFDFLWSSSVFPDYDRLLPNPHFRYPRPPSLQTAEANRNVETLVPAPSLKLSGTLTGTASVV
jgi:hypothetical protein